ncbi:hypothetical protein SAMN05192548_104026 [Paraburkholderia terricola]|uniref:Uncharacterized protein n=1 Tax=Paraburkholderia terricola TaxID=169427 RepID=A0A1M6VNB8_9BURK|nr:hypothetical protein SAMN05192547_104046 [Paraburkholderia sediminicola]SHK82821.1 hypothetical protein SAMN05192548_104026 [Paraburkholderia terricola]
MKVTVTRLYRLPESGSDFPQSTRLLEYPWPRFGT